MLLLMDYFLRLLPSLIVVVAIYLLVPQEITVLKIFVLIFGFILMQDAMTPLNTWVIGVNGNVLWLRFIEDAFILITIGLLSQLVTLLICFSNRYLTSNFIGFKTNSKSRSLFIGTLVALLIAVLFMLTYLFIPIQDRGGEVALHLLLPLLILALIGNLLEEVLFRCFLQNYLKLEVGITKSIALSGLIFTLGHTFLAITVTDLGFWVIISTLYEGLVCTYLSERYGLASATIAHGLAIFILSAGLI